MKHILAHLAGAALAIGVTYSAGAATQVGVLTCTIQPGTGLVVGSSHDVRCVFEGNGHRDHYSGKINRVGLDVGFTSKAMVTWAVFAPSNFRGKHALRGDYVGASGDVAVGIGAGANVLVGGNGNTISLQPLSVKSETGVALALGAGDLHLH